MFGVEKALVRLSMRFLGAVLLSMGCGWGFADGPDWLVQGQYTWVEQHHPAFNGSSSGLLSLEPEASSRETMDATLFLGRRLWEGAELWLNPEIDQGFGLNNTTGVAGYVSGEAYKIGDYTPYVRLQRFFLRQTIPLSEAGETEEAQSNHFQTAHADQELIMTLGRYSVVDLFDGNRYAHDPKADFLNWSVIDSGAFDYAADPWGFTQGASLEWTAGQNVLRAGFFQMSDAPNEKIVGVRFANHMWVVEDQWSYQWGDQAGALRLLGYVNDARTAAYRDALNLGTVDLAGVRHAAQKTGYALNWEQALSATWGAFLRWSQNDGRHEAFEFTDINQSLALGLQWIPRAADRVGVALVQNQLSTDAQAFFAAGGQGILIGEGTLHYAPEQIAEAYYAWAMTESTCLTFDVQTIRHPAYNQTRGPVTVFGARFHVEF